MKRRFVTLVLIMSSLLSSSVFADGTWDPSGPKICTWFMQVVGYAQNLWEGLVR
jgi:hypothetical protein